MRAAIERNPSKIDLNLRDSVDTTITLPSSQETVSSQLFDFSEDNDWSFDLETPPIQSDYVPMFPNPCRNTITNFKLDGQRRELERSSFTLDLLIGSGHFGKVFRGVATGLFDPASKTRVAIKTTNNPSKQDEVTSLACEAKILSNLDFHLNLVNLLGLCTSNVAYTGDLWLVLEYCNEGDMKSFLQKHRQEFSNSIIGNNQLLLVN